MIFLSCCNVLSALLLPPISVVYVYKGHTDHEVQVEDEKETRSRHGRETVEEISGGQGRWEHNEALNPNFIRVPKTGLERQGPC
jgi:hypothetical protein